MQEHLYFHVLSYLLKGMVFTTNTPVEMVKIKVETSTTQEPHEIEYVDVELFSEDEKMKVGNGKVIILE